MLIATELKRVFIMDNKGGQVILSDPDPTWSANEVLGFYANTYPILTTASVSAPQFGDDALEYKFESMMGTKG